MTGIKNYSFVCATYKNVEEEKRINFNSGIAGFFRPCTKG
jgi:hypothetical protein